jgi:hypothetical protein
MLALLLLLPRKCQWRFLLLLIPINVTRLMLTLMGVTSVMLNPMGAIRPELIPLIRKNSRRYIVSGESSGVPSPALSALVGLQELSLANFDQTLEDMVPEDLLSEPIDGGMMEVCADMPDVRLELS